ncbi:MAG: hypothetical protein IJV80_03160 [Clostridia bacterium]|nr:hypothetical protein [Clostridia bacterium]
MKRSLSLWQLAGLTFTAALGTLFHFLYLWTDWLVFTPVCAVNESTWEHMKILFFPAFFFAIFQSFFFRADYPAFWRVKAKGILRATLLIPVLFYVYNGAFGPSPAWYNVLTFFVAAGYGFIYEWFALKRDPEKRGFPVLSIVFLCLVAIFFVVFTYLPPTLPLF